MTPIYGFKMVEEDAELSKRRVLCCVMKADFFELMLWSFFAISTLLAQT